MEWTHKSCDKYRADVYVPHHLDLPALQTVMLVMYLTSFFFLTSLQLTDGGKAAKGGITVGDMVLSIDGIATEGMNHLEAQNKIKSCTGNLSLTLQK